MEKTMYLVARLYSSAVTPTTLFMSDSVEAVEAYAKAMRLDNPDNEYAIYAKFI